MDAYNTDVRPLLAELREDMGLDPDPIAAYQRSGYAEKIVADRVGGTQPDGAAGERRSPTPPPTCRQNPRRDLLQRSNRLGSDPPQHQLRRRQHLGQGRRTDPVTGEPVELLWVKGSGGDLGTLTADGLAVLRLDRLRALADVYPGVEREDEMVAAFDYCLHGKGGAAPSIDTAMHGLVDAPHVDHLHPDSGIALATAADGEALTRACFGDRVRWVPWRRPGFQLGLDIAAMAREHPEAIGIILGGHGITAWGATSEECEANSLAIIAAAQQYLEEHGAPEPFGPVIPGYEPLPARSGRPGPRRWRRSCAAWPRPTGPRSGTSPTARPCWTSRPGEAPAAGGARHVVPGSLPAHQGPADGARPAALGPGGGRDRPAARAARRLPRGLPRPTTSGTPRRTHRRCAAPIPRSCWSPASGCSASAPTSRPPGWPASSTSTRST